MALILVDGFDYFDTGYNRVVAEAMGWTGNTGYIGGNDTTAFGYGKSMAFGAGVNNIYGYRDARGRHDENRTLVWGQRLYIESGHSLDVGTVDTYTSGSTIQWRVNLGFFGNVYFYNGDGSLIGMTPAGTFSPSEWFYLEIKWKPGSGTSGTMEVRINTVVVMSFPATNTANGTLLTGTTRGFDLLYIHPNNGANSHRYDDWYLLDDTGTVNTGYLGNVRVKMQLPVSDSTPLQWSIGGSVPASTNWQSVIDNALDDSKYVYDSTVSDRDLYNIDPNLNTPAVYGFELIGFYRMDDATQRVVKNSIKTSSGGTTQYGQDWYINQSYTAYPDIFEINPDTSVQYTGAEVNALKIGPEVVA